MKRRHTIMKAWPDEAGGSPTVASPTNASTVSFSKQSNWKRVKKGGVEQMKKYYLGIARYALSLPILSGFGVSMN